MIKKSLLSLFAAAFGFSSASYAIGGGDPSSLKIKVYAVYASLSPQCTNPIQVFTDAGTYQDFMASPTLGGGDLADGTYNCVIIKMSSIIKHTPLTAVGSDCAAGTEYVGGVCNATDVATDLNNSAITCTGDGTNAGSVDSTVYMYMTTDAAASTGDHAFEHPMVPADGKGIRLLNPLVINSVTRAKFVMDAHGKVVGGGGECGIDAPVFDFQNL